MFITVSYIVCLMSEYIDTCCQRKYVFYNQQSSVHGRQSVCICQLRIRFNERLCKHLPRCVLKPVESTSAVIVVKSFYDAFELNENVLLL